MPSTLSKLLCLNDRYCIFDVTRNHDMALGKRKRRDELKVAEDTECGSNENDVDLQTLFQQHFEAKFRPLQPTSLPVKVPTFVRSQSASEDGTSDWEGLPDEEEYGPEVIELEASRTLSDDVFTEELRSYMVNIRSRFELEIVI